MSAATRRAAIIRSLWQEKGWRDIDIAKAFNLSRERIRQLHQGLTRDWVTITTAGKQVGIGIETIYSWVGQGYVTMSPSGLVKPKEIEMTRDALKSRPCRAPGCDDEIGVSTATVVFCAEHRQARKEHRYREYWREEDWERHRAHVRAYNARHPEKVAEIGRLGRERRKAAKSQSA